MGDKVELCVIYDDWYNDKKEYRHGLTSDYLKKNGASQKLACNMHAGGITIPNGQEKPYVMVALGTGIAPMRAMVQERGLAKSQGEKCGPMSMFFGNRHYETEFF